MNADTTPDPLLAELVAIEAELREQAAATTAAATEYARHLRDGGDPSTMPGDRWKNPASHLAHRINDAYRAGQGLPVIPASPVKGGRTYDLLEYMIVRQGQWLSFRQELKKVAAGGQVQNMLDRPLRGSPWKLERREATAGVEYRIVPADDDQAAA